MEASHGLLWGDVRGVVLNVDESVPYVYVVVEPGGRNDYAVSLHASFSQGMGYFTVFVSDDPKEVELDDEKVERMRRLDFPENIFIYSTKLDETTFTYVRKWLRKAIDAGLYVIRFVIVEQGSNKVVYMEDVNMPLDEGKKLSFTSLLDALEREYWMLNINAPADDASIYLSRVHP
jgi:hypothetical protein